jgi:hypothetical protein
MRSRSVQREALFGGPRLRVSRVWANCSLSSETRCPQLREIQSQLREIVHFSKRIGMALSKFTSLVILKMCIWTVWLWLGISSGRAATAPGGVREFNIILSDCCSILSCYQFLWKLEFLINLSLRKRKSCLFYVIALEYHSTGQYSAGANWQNVPDTWLWLVRIEYVRECILAPWLVNL